MEQVFLLDVHGVNLKFKVQKLEVVDVKYFRKKEQNDPNAASLVSLGLRGLLNRNTEFSFSKGTDSSIMLKGGTNASRRALFKYVGASKRTHARDKLVSTTCFVAMCMC
jgi:hypothetical protein